MLNGKVTHQLKEETHLCHVVEQVRVFELLWNLVPNGLRVHASAITIAADQTVLNHLTLDADKVLNLVSNDPATHKIHESFLDLIATEWLFTMAAIPLSNEAVVVFVQVGIPADV